MTDWRRRMQPASFRGVAFVALESGLSSERRVVEHEYPLVDGSDLEDLGRGARRFRLDISVVGDDVRDRRDKLEAALDLPAEGQLVHPTRGLLTVRCLRYDSTDGPSNECRISAEFVEVQAPRAIAAPAYQQAIDGLATAAVEAIGATLGVAVRTVAEPAWIAADAVQSTTDAIASVREAITGPIGYAVDGIAELAESLADLEATIDATVIQAPATIMADLEAALLPLTDTTVCRAMTTAFGEDAPDISSMTPDDGLAAMNALYLRRGVIRTALVAYCRASAATEFVTFDDAVAVRDLISLRLGSEIDRADGAEASALAALRAATIGDLNVRARSLPTLRSITVAGPVGTLQLAQDLYGDADRNLEISARNGILHPGFVTGHLEVLSE